MEAYPELRDKVWQHGDFIETTVHGGYKITGKSDNPKSVVENSTAELYGGRRYWGCNWLLAIDYQVMESDIILFLKSMAWSLRT